MGRLSGWQGELAGQRSERVSYLMGQVAFGPPLGRQGRYVGLGTGLAPSAATRPGAAAVEDWTKRRRAFAATRCQSFAMDYRPAVEISVT